MTIAPGFSSTFASRRAKRMSMSVRSDVNRASVRSPVMRVSSPEMRASMSERSPARSDRSVSNSLKVMIAPEFQTYSITSVRTYVGGNRFFNTEEPDDNQALIRLVQTGEQRQLLNPAQPIPAGLKESILFFLVSSAAAIVNLGLGERGYSYLCHPSLKNDEQAIAQTRINDFLT